MKKVLLFVIIAVMFSGIYAHEVTANLDVASEEAMGLSFTQGDLWWGDGTYLVDFMITGTADQPVDFTLCQAWKKVNLWDLADFQIGRNSLSYGRIYTSRGSRNLQIQRLSVAPLVWSFKLHKQMGKFHLYSDAVWPQIGLADVAGRLAYESDKLTIGASGVMGNLSQYFEEDGNTEGFYGFDLDFVLANFLRVSGQYSVERVGSEANYYVIASYEPGFEMPYMGKRIGRVIYGEWRPYVGMITRNGDDDGEGMGDSNIFGGINYQSFENSYLKFEVNMDSNDDIDPSFLVQLGYKF